MFKTEFIGRLGRDPEMRYMPSGAHVTNISVAVSERWKKDGEKFERVHWIRCSAFGKLAEVVNEYLKKGSKVWIEGTLRSDDKGNPRTYEKGDGTWAASHELTIREIEFLDSKSQGEAAADDEADETEAKPKAKVGTAPESEDDFPF